MIYQIGGLTRANWKQLWPTLIAGEPLMITGHRPHVDTTDAVLMFDFPDATAPLALACRVEQVRNDGCVLVADAPPLSWRLAAVDIARGLPDHSQPPSLNSTIPAEETPLDRRRLQLRWDIPCPAHTLAPGQDLPEAITALRAGFFELDELVEHTPVSRRRLAPFIDVLHRLDIVVDAPRPLDSWNTPFSFLGLHWSAHDPLVRRRYQELNSRVDDAPAVAGVAARRFLERAYTLLCQPDVRRQIRCQLLPPAAVAGVTTYFRRQLQRARQNGHLSAATDAARRLLELEPSDRQTRRTLTSLLCRQNGS